MADNDFLDRPNDYSSSSEDETFRLETALHKPGQEDWTCDYAEGLSDAYRFLTSFYGLFTKVDFGGFCQLAYQHTV